ncbi:uncharacterized protein [Chanodichthys erythropterus]|uniref:uncharacterized protein n=1 Tax=Chanodichthys erythropterus TaxID=933992 RepID=UPI00351F1514
MSPQPDFLKNLLEYLKGTAVFTSLPLTLLLIGLEKLVEVEFFLCPCIFKINALLTASIFIGPALLTFTLIFLLVRPFKHKYSGCCAQPNPSDAQQNPSNSQQNPSDAQQNPSDDQQNPSDAQQNPSNSQQNPSDAQQNPSDDQQNPSHAQQNPSDAQQNPSDAKQNCPNAFASCLIPPVIWICILLLDGKYVACAMTHWNGVYVLDEELNMFWCKPTEKIQNETELRDSTRKYIYNSQYAGYILISVFSALVILIVGIHDCCISKKCECCPSRLLSCWRQPVRTRGGAISEDGIPLETTPFSTAPN